MSGCHCGGRRSAPGGSIVDDSAPIEEQQGTWAAETASDRSDAELLLGLCAHRRAALQELYTRYFPPVYALAVRMLDDPDAADECVQVVFLRIEQHSALVDPPRGDVCMWLLQAIHQQARTQQRLPFARPPPIAADPPNTTAAADAPTGLGRFDPHRRLAEHRQSARAALAILSPVERTVLELAYFRSMTLSEIAASQSVPPGTVQTQLRAGLDRLRVAVAGEAASVAAGEESASRALISPSVVPAEPTLMSQPSPPLSPLVQLADTSVSMGAIPSGL
ncbi:MAG: RNA polymerase sigma factor [Chloroflexia bacterium]